MICVDHTGLLFLPLGGIATLNRSSFGGLMPDVCNTDALELGEL